MVCAISSRRCENRLAPLLIDPPVRIIVHIGKQRIQKQTVSLCSPFKRPARNQGVGIASFSQFSGTYLSPTFPWTNPRRCSSSLSNIIGGQARGECSCRLRRGKRREMEASLHVSSERERAPVRTTTKRMVRLPLTLGNHGSIKFTRLKLQSAPKRPHGDRDLTTHRSFPVPAVIGRGEEE
jgi:hypothetical protein